MINGAYMSPFVSSMYTHPSLGQSETKMLQAGHISPPGAKKHMQSHKVGLSGDPYNAAAVNISELTRVIHPAYTSERSGFNHMRYTTA